MAANEPVLIKEKVVVYAPGGLVDSIDGNYTRKNAMSSMLNLMPSPSTPGLMICRSAAFQFMDFPGLSSPGYVSVHATQATRIYGMVASSRNPGFDEPFCYDQATGTEITISGITSTNAPVSPATTGEWTPPTVSFVGGWVVFTHPGFNGTNGYFGWLDISGYSLSSAAGTTAVGLTTISNLNENPLTAGVTIGMAISDARGEIPAAARVTAVTGSGTTGTITISLPMVSGVISSVSTGSNTGTTLSDTAQAWVTNAYAGATVQITSGTGVVTGTSSGSNSSTTLNDTAQSWTINAFDGYEVLITSGTGSGQNRAITANTGTQLTVSPAWTTTPDGTSVYSILPTATVSSNTATVLTISSTWATTPNATSHYTLTPLSTSNPLTITGGTTAAPMWNSGNTNLNPLPSVPICASIFFNRVYFGCGNSEFFTDVLNPLQISNGSNSLNLTGSSPIIGSINQSFINNTSVGGTTAALLVFKKEGIWQITGDSALSTLALNPLASDVGTDAPRSLANTPIGTMFVAADGVRTIDLGGNVKPPQTDLTTPFLSTSVPSRIAACYSIGVYRICSWSTIAGVTVPQSYWFDTVRGAWYGPHTLIFDCISAFGAGVFPNDETFLVSGSSYPGQILQSNILPSSTDNFMEFGEDLTWGWQTVVLPETEPMVTISIGDCSLFMSVRNSFTLTGTVYDQSNNVLGTVSAVTPVFSPSNAENWQISWVPASGVGLVQIPNRMSIAFSGPSGPGFGIGAINLRLQWQKNTNSTVFSSIVLPSSIDFGSVADDLLTTTMDWGGVVDMVTATVDFESIGPIVPGPP
jgi:hypothetical protein